MRDFYDKNFKTLKKEIEDDIKRYKDLSSGKSLGIEKGKWPSNQKQSTDSMQSPSKFQHNSSQILKRPQLHMET